MPGCVMDTVDHVWGRSTGRHEKNMHQTGRASVRSCDAAKMMAPRCYGVERRNEGAFVRVNGWELWCGFLFLS